jgi:probable F420-dependent oxidoreductase
MTRYGMTIPFPGPLHAQRPLIQELEGLGYTDVWSAEAGGEDAFTPLVLASTWASTLRLGTAIVPAFTRAPAVMAQSVASLCSAAPGRVAFGIGTSSDVIVERWNGVAFERPYHRVRDMVRFLRLALTGEKVTRDFDTFSVTGFRLGVRVDDQPALLVAALREGMLRMAGREGDGAIINWLSPPDVARVAPIVHDQGDDKEIVARVFVAPIDDRETVLREGKFVLAAYVNVPVYRAFHEWMGRGEALAEHWDRWAAGDRQGSLEAIPDHLVDELIVHGTPEQCRARIGEYYANGVTTAALAVLPFTGVDIGQAARDLAPG